MLIVVDANVICSGMLSKGKTIDILFSGKIEPVAPELLFTEFDEHKSELLARSKLSEQEFEVVLASLKRRINIIPAVEFEDRLAEANKALFPHTKDTEYVALALKLGCPLWSEEKRLKKQSKVKVFSTGGLLEELGLKK